MITAILTLLIVCFLFWLGYKITGALISAIIWICVKLPLGIILITLGILLCITILGIPLGKALCSSGFKLIIPGI